MGHLQLGLLRRNHELGADVLVEVLGADDLELHGGLLEREAVLVRVLGGLGGGVVADDGVEAGDQHKPFMNISIDFLRSAVRAWGYCDLSNHGSE
jgi:hypothetical protein